MPNIQYNGASPSGSLGLSYAKTIDVSASGTSTFKSGYPVTGVRITGHFKTSHYSYSYNLHFVVAANGTDYEIGNLSGRLFNSTTQPGVDLSVYLDTSEIPIEKITAVKYYDSSSNKESIFLSGATTVLAYYLEPTSCSAPTVVMLNGVDGNISRLQNSGDITLSWSGAAAGDYNAITGYQVYRNGSAYGSKVVTGQTSGSATVVINGSIGSAYTYSVKTLGTFAGYDSALSAERSVTTASRVSAPTKLTISNTTPDAGTTTALSWSGSKDGTSNPVKSYRIYKAAGADSNYTLFAETSTTTLSVFAPDDQGESFYYKVSAVGTLGDESARSEIYVICTAKVYGPVSAPSNVRLDSGVVSAGVSTTLRWSSASGGTNTSVVGYRVYKSTLADSGFAILGETTSTSYDVTAPSASGNSYYYAVQAIASKSADYDSILSSVVRLAVPAAPGVPLPEGVTDADAVSWCSRPRILFTVPDNDIESMMQSIIADGWSASRSGVTAGSRVVLRRSTASAESTENVTFYTEDQYGGISSGKSISVKISHASWTDETLQAGVSAPKAAHITELRTALGQICRWYGLTAPVWSENIVAGVTPTLGWYGHISEIWACINRVVSAVNGWDDTNSIMDINLPTFVISPVPSASVIMALRDIIKNL